MTDPRTFDADTFMEEELWHWLKWQNSYDSIRLWGRGDSSERARKRCLNFARRNRLILESQRIDEQTIQITYKGTLFELDRKMNNAG